MGRHLVQIMACYLFGAWPLSKPMLGYGQLDPQELSSHENASENVACELAAILSRGT